MAHQRTPANAAGWGDARIVTIDGPAGTGKSATARALAQRLGLLCLDSGALYRAFAWAAERDHVTPGETEAFARWVAHVPVQVQTGTGTFRVRVGDRDIGEEVRREAIGQAASRLATLPAIRERVALLLREASKLQPCVAEGRDMGSVVFPEACPKLFLTASLEARTARRAAQLRALGMPAEETEIRNDIQERDLRDESRALSPLRVPAGGVRIDTSGLTLEEQINLAVELVRGRGHWPGSRFFRGTQAFLRVIFQGLCGVRVHGREHVPPGACVIACNHQAYTDPPLIGSLLPGAAAFLAKEELFRGPLGWLIRKYYAIPVRRGAADRRALRTCLEILRRGRPLLIFPEGTRIRGRSLGTPHPGVAWLARRADAPVLPVLVTGGSLLRSLLRREAQQVRFGEPLAPPGADRGTAPNEAQGEGDAAFAARVMAAIAALEASSHQRSAGGDQA